MIKKFVSLLNVSILLLVAAISANGAEQNSQLTTYINYYEKAVTDGRTDDAEFAAKRAYELVQADDSASAETRSRINVMYANSMLMAELTPENYEAVFSSYEAALNMIEEETDLQEDLYGKDSIEMLDTYFSLGRAHIKNQSRGKADKSFKKAISVAEKNNYSNEQLGDLNKSISDWLVNEGYGDFAELYLKNAGKEYAKLDASVADIRVAEIDFELARIKYNDGNYQGAKKRIEKILSGLDDEHMQSELYYDLNVYLGKIYHRNEDLDKALAIVDQLSDHEFSHKDIVFNAFETKSVSIVNPLGSRDDYGSVIAICTITSEGRVENIQFVSRRIPAVVTGAVRDALERYEYMPRYVNGVAVDSPNHRIAFFFRP